MPGASTSLIAPAGVTGAVYGQSGATYQVDANGFISGVTFPDIEPLISAGWRFPAPLLSSQPLSANGLAVTRSAFTSFSNLDGTPLAATASAGKFGLSCTLGTLFALLGEAATSNTKTDVALVEAAVPAGYIAGNTITATVNAQLNGTGTPGTKTVLLGAYKVSPNGVMSANLVTASAQAITAAAADYAFPIPAGSVNPGDRLLLSVTAVTQETGGTNSITTQVNSVRLS
jgi:hypothetical protein